MKQREVLRLFLLVTVIVFIISWVLGVLRFEWEPAHDLYAALNFPFGFAYLFAEKYFRTRFSSSFFMNDEIIQIIFWLVSVLFQALFYTWMIHKIYWKRKQDRVTL